jgi:hypothetical protein
MRKTRKSVSQISAEDMSNRDEYLGERVDLDISQKHEKLMTGKKMVLIEVPKDVPFVHSV